MSKRNAQNLQLAFSLHRGGKFAEAAALYRKIIKRNPKEAYAIARVERVTQCGRWLRRPLKAEHALVPRLDREPVGLLARFRRPLCRRLDRRAVDALA
jgi:hypothetical protein